MKGNEYDPQATGLTPDKLAADLRESEQRQEPVRDWWNRAHQSSHVFWLSGTEAREVWQRLDVESQILPGRSVLDIGVGLGTCTRALAELGCEVHALDISPIALERVKPFARTHLASDLSSLPAGYFDLALSHLVAQHMNTENLLAQFEAVIRALKRGGILAVQFAKPLTDSAETNESPAAEKGGGCLRTPAMMVALAERAGGRVTRTFEKERFQASAWHVLHVTPA